MDKDIPFQVMHLIDQMLNKQDNVHVRANYRQRLDSIRKTIDQSIKKYDNEMLMASSVVKGRSNVKRV
jgi:hypothetical protein